MSTFTLKLSPDGAVVRALITPSSDDEGERREVTIQGVLDSGADFTVIDNSVVRQLGLEPVGKQLIHGVGTGTKPVWADIYRVNVRISATSTDEPSYFIRNVAVVDAVLFRMRANGHLALFGRDVLDHFLFTYNGVLQTFSLTYGGQLHLDG